MAMLNSKFSRHMSQLAYSGRLRRSRKKYLVELKGGECEICGKSYPQCVFDFHHRDSTEKKRNIGASLSAVSEKRFLSEIVPEAMECALLCSNCHRILHFDKESPKNKE